MKGLRFLSLALLALGLHTLGIEAIRKPGDSVLLSNVKTLTLRKDLKTSHRRVAAVPQARYPLSHAKRAPLTPLQQLKCIGGNAKGLYDIDVMRCKNQGSDYEDENIQWTCTASLPADFKLGSTDVICEGYESSKDPYILKGSCGVEYRLQLTALGEEKYGRGGGKLFDGFKGKGSVWPGIMFWGLFIAVVGWMIYAAFIRDRVGGIRRGRGNNPWGWGGGPGGGPGGDDPPPPYDYHSKPSTRGARPAAGAEAWRPGFWTGALGGAAAGYMAGNRPQQQRNQGLWGNQDGFWNSNDDHGEGGSGWGGRTRSSGSSSSSFSLTRHESTGFGSTSRR